MTTSLQFDPLSFSSYLNSLTFYVFVVAKIQPNFNVPAITRGNSSVGPAAAMAPNTAQRKVYVIGVGMTKVCLELVNCFEFH